MFTTRDEEDVNFSISVTKVSANGIEKETRVSGDPCQLISNKFHVLLCNTILSKVHV